MSNQHLRVRSTAGLLDIVRYLENVIAAFKKGRIVIDKEGESIALVPNEPVKLALEADVKLDRHGLREKVLIELKWEGVAELREHNDSFVICPRSEVQEEEPAPREDKPPRKAKLPGAGRTAGAGVARPGKPAAGARKPVTRKMTRNSAAAR